MGRPPPAPTAGGGVRDALGEVVHPTADVGPARHADPARGLGFEATDEGSHLNPTGPGTPG